MSKKVIYQLASLAVLGAVANGLTGASAQQGGGEQLQRTCAAVKAEIAKASPGQGLVPTLKALGFTEAKANAEAANYSNKAAFDKFLVDLKKEIAEDCK